MQLNGTTVEVGVEVVCNRRTPYTPQPEFISEAEAFLDRGWIQTWSGKRFSLARPDPADVDILDIAVSLSRIPRFGGHTSTSYFVAQHAVLASCYCEEYSLSALMHDASEAYTNDITRPLKLGLGDRMAQIEDNIHRAIALRFGIRQDIPSEVKAVDLMLLATEQRDLMRHPIDWGCTRNIKPHPETIGPWPSHVALVEFLKRFQLLTNQPINWENVPKE